MKVSVTQESGNKYTFWPSSFIGGWTESVWSLEAIDATAKEPTDSSAGSLVLPPVERVSRR